MSTQVGVELELDSASLAAFLNGPECQRMVSEAAHRIAQATGVDGVRVRGYAIDRKAAVVSVPADAQARDGALTRAAASLGLTVRRRAGDDEGAS